MGSFDDDADYILGAKAIVAGHGLTGHQISGAVISGAYPPGFSLLLSPLAALWPHDFVAMRLACAATTAILLPATWWYLGRRRVPDAVRVLTMVVLALNVVMATFATMVMAEGPTMLLLIGLLVLAERWEGDEHWWSKAGIGAIVAAAGLVWLKEAALGMGAGLALWMLYRRQITKAVATVVGVGLLLLPVVVARLIAHSSLAGSRYSQELGGYYSGGLGGRLVHVLPHGFGQYVSTALPRTIVPYGDPLPVGGGWSSAANILSWHVALFCLVGLIVWIRRYRDASVLVVPVYAAETLLWPYINERRVVLALPVLAAWYALGGWTIGRAVVRVVRSRRWRPRPWQAGLALAGVLLCIAPLCAQVNRDYLFNSGQDSSRPIGSRYSAILRHGTTPGSVIESDYLSTTALISGHRTAEQAFLASNGVLASDEIRCSPTDTEKALAGDRAGYLLIGAFNHPGVLDSECLLDLADAQPWAVRLLETARDVATVFELIGPGTSHPDLANALTASTLRGSGPGGLVVDDGTSFGPESYGTPIVGGEGTLTRTWGAPETVRQVSIGEAGATGTTSRVRLQLQAPDGHWFDVATSPGAVGDGHSARPYLLTAYPHGVRATGVRVVVDGTGDGVAADWGALVTGAAP